MAFSDTPSLPSLSNGSTTHNTPLSTPTATEFAYDRFPSSQQTSSSSWMSSAYKAYGQSKVMRYVESGVRSIAVPIYGRIGKSFRDEQPVDKVKTEDRTLFLFFIHVVADIFVLSFTLID